MKGQPNQSPIQPSPTPPAKYPSDNSNWIANQATRPDRAT